LRLREVRDEEAAGSNPVTPTGIPAGQRLAPIWWEPLLLEVQQQNACAVPFHSNNKTFGPSASARLFANHYRRATSTEPPDPSLKTMLLDLFEHPSAHHRRWS